MKTGFLPSLCLLCLCSGTLAQNINPFIIVDQFGYLPQSQKIAVVKDPKTGFDTDGSYNAGSKYIVVNAITGEYVFSGQPVLWNSGATDASSGDKVWHFDFSGVTETGRYFILDSIYQQRSYEFEISPMVYREVLKQAVRAFYYQRAGFAKKARYAGDAWADSASHIGPLQDKNCRLYSDKNNPATERDVSGGWYDAGDYNKYTNWTASYVVEMAKAYLENPKGWGDDYNLPESGNGVPDLLDEAKWGIEHLLRMQQDDGGVLCIVSESHASPPSSATGQSVYGPATTSASFNTAAALAISARVCRVINMPILADSLTARAEKAWNWAVANPNVIFHNNSSENNSLGVGAGDQEEDDYGRSMSKLEAACFLFETTGKAEYGNYFNNNYQSAHLLMWNFAYPYEPAVQDLLLYYTTIPGANTTVSNNIRNAYKNAMVTNSDNFPAYYNVKDPYRAHMDAYTWGSNNQKGAQGSMFYSMITFSLDPARDQDALNAASGYIHYIHGVNPLNMVYLSNMYGFGGDNCANEFYHSWFCNGSTMWDRVGVSLYGPPPGYVPGGPNPSYNWDGCCNTLTCGSPGNNAICNSESLSPPKNQPKQKSYKDFNTSWPLNSWEITENSGGYQVSYIRLLSKFVDIHIDCNGDSAGTATMDTCGICSGGNTGRTPVTEPCNCPDFKRTTNIRARSCDPYTSPSGKYVWTESGFYNDTIPAANGCDSILLFQLILPPPQRNDVTITVCDEYSSPSGKYKWTESGIYTDTIPAMHLCDSIITYDLEVLHSSESEITITSCDPVFSPSNLYEWTISGIYTDVLPNAAGCDSVITVNLTIPVINVAVSQAEDTLTALATNATFQWLQCDNDSLPVENAVNGIFTPVSSGSYAVEVQQEGCVDTSDCYSVTITGIVYNTLGKGLVVYPNPANTFISVILPEMAEMVDVELKNLAGQILQKSYYSNILEFELPLHENPGLYLLHIRNNKGHLAVIKLLVE